MSEKSLGVLNIVLAILLVGLGVAIWFTASTVLSILFGIVLLVGALNVTGVLGSLFGSKNV